jgi:4-hydroxymandelate oxidase
MVTMWDVQASRRQLFRLLAASPLLALASGSARTESDGIGIIKTPKEAINVFDLEVAARAKLPPAHWGFIATGVDDDLTLAANREGFKKIQLRPRLLRDVSHVDMSVELFGTKWESPIILAPAGSQRAFHPEGEIAVARAASTSRTLQILSTGTTCAIEKVAEAAGRPIWYQLYGATRWDVSERMIRRAEAVGCPVLVLTVDLNVGRTTETLERFVRTDTRVCSSCHTSPYDGKPMFQGIDMTGATLLNAGMTWEWVRKLKSSTRMKLVLKGIQTREDAVLCLENGVDGIIVSNHGGRSEETGGSTIETLPEVLDAVQGRIPVLVDSGFRRGTDIFKALALGARAICIGRPYLWGLAAFGQSGVERVVDLLQAELQLLMGQCGTRSIADITRTSIIRQTPSGADQQDQKGRSVSSLGFGKGAILLPILH